MKYFLSAIFLALSLGSLLGLSKTQSFFSDEEKVLGNTLEVGVWVTPIPSPTGVVINEVYYDVCTPASQCGNDPQNEWIELYNPTGSAVDIKNWTITDNHETDTISTTSATLYLPANGFALISRENDTWNFWNEPANTLIINLGENIGNGLNNDGDRVVLKDSTGATIDAMSYGDDTSQLNPSETDVIAGHSLERDPDGIDTNTNADFVDRTTPTPGS